jgi:hypothetical protein
MKLRPGLRTPQPSELQLREVEKMRVPVFSRHVLGICVTAAMLAACGGPQPPISAPGAMPQSSAIATHAERGKSWILPSAKKNDLLYISDEQNVYIFSYPQGNRVGNISISAGPTGVCADKRGDIFVPIDDYYQIWEYKRGGTTKVGTLYNPKEYMTSCFVDPVGGDLAVVDADGDGGGGVSIYRKAKGNPSVYTDTKMEEASSGTYDNEGNIFLTGTDQSENFEFAELPSKSVGFTTINLDVTISALGLGVGWDGTYVVVGAGNGVLYQTNGAGGQVEGQVNLKDTTGPTQFVVDPTRQTVVGTGFANSTPYTFFWPYPAGGDPSLTLSGFRDPYGVAISFAPKHR